MNRPVMCPAEVKETSMATSAGNSALCIESAGVFNSTGKEIASPDYIAPN